MNPPPSTPDLLGQVRALAESVEALDAAVRDRAAVEALDVLESLKNACAGAQARLAVRRMPPPKRRRHERPLVAPITMQSLAVPRALRPLMQTDRVIHSKSFQSI